MNPAYSVIFFTTSSGAGYGLWIWAALAAIVHGGEARTAILLALALGAVLVTAGLLASLFHLGHPERAWRAFSQWRTSWLSREGVAAVMAYLPALWLGFEAWTGPTSQAAATLTIITSALTVYCTAMIYASLRPIPRWHHPLVPRVYLALALATGFTIGVVVGACGGVADWPLWAHGAAAMLLITGLVKALYWKKTDAVAGPSVASAIGLADYDVARLFEGPGSTQNFVQREMGYVIARKHAHKLRRIAAAAAFATFSLLILAGTQGSAPAALAAVLSVTVMVLVERWLFFAEAEHMVGKYYRREAEQEGRP